MRVHRSYPDQAILEIPRIKGFFFGIFVLLVADMRQYRPCTHHSIERERSEERRVGKECRSRWSPNHYKNNSKFLEKDGKMRHFIKYFGTAHRQYAQIRNPTPSIDRARNSLSNGT